MAPFQDAIAGLQAATKADVLAKADPAHSLAACLAFHGAKALVNAALAETTNTPAIEAALRAKLAEVDSRLEVLSAQVDAAALQAALAQRAAAAAEEPPPTATAPPPAAAAAPAPAPAAAPPGPPKDYFKESFKLLKLAMAADARGKRGDAAQALEAAVQFSLTLEMLDLALHPGNCAPNIQEKLRVKREEVIGRRAALAGAVGAENLQAALAEARVAADRQDDTPPPPPAPAPAPAFVVPAQSRAPPSPAPQPEPEPEPQPQQSSSAYPATPGTLPGSPFVWRAPPSGGLGGGEGGGVALFTPASAMYGGLSPISSTGGRSHTAADALAKMERTLAESSRALASVRAYSAKTMAEVDGNRSRKLPGSGPPSPVPTTPGYVGRMLAVDGLDSPGAASSGPTPFDEADAEGDISASLRALPAERARRERAESSLRREAARRAEAEHAAKVASDELQRLETALAAAEREVKTSNTELERRESQLAEQARILEKTQTDASQAVRAAEDRARGMTHDRLERASEKARAYADEAVQRSTARVEVERRLKEEAQSRAQQEAVRRQAAERRAEEAADALSKAEQIQAVSEKKAQHSAQVLAQKERELAEAHEAMHRAKEEADRIIAEAQAQAREEAESRGKAAAEAAMQVAEEAAERASEKVTTEIALRDEALARSRAEVAKREAAERRGHELSENLLRLEVMHEEAQEALLRSQDEADAAAELAESLRRQADDERMSHQEEARGVSEARRAAELRAEETAMALAKAQAMLNAQAEALARVRADADRLVTDATAKAAEKVTSAVNLKKQAVREADTRLRREVAARTRLERQQSETVEALAKTEAMLAASTEALEQARKEAATLRFKDMPMPDGGAGFASAGVPEGTPVPFDRSGWAEPYAGGGANESKAVARLAERRARRANANTSRVQSTSMLSTTAGASAYAASRSRRPPRGGGGVAVITQAEERVGGCVEQPQEQLLAVLRRRGLERFAAQLSAFVRSLEELSELTEEDAAEIGMSSDDFRLLVGV